MEIPEILNVTVIEPRLKHPVVFERFDALKQGSSFVIQNDHDPKPLYYQLLAERGPVFSWKLLEEGPDVWAVKITKRLATNIEDTIGDIVSRDYRTALVFKQLGIDFCCGGKSTISEACDLKGLSIEAVTHKLAGVVDTSVAPDMNFQNWDIGFLCKYLVQLHHQYIRNNTSFILDLAKKVSKTYGDKFQEITRVLEIFDAAGKLLMLNIIKEESVLFIYIADLNEAHKKMVSIDEPAFGPVSVPIYLMEAEHEKIAEDFQLIRQLTNNYILPPYVSHGYNILYKMLQEYEDDLHLHLHLENNILFPNAIKIEDEMRNKKLISAKVSND